MLHQFEGYWFVIYCIIFAGFFVNWLDNCSFHCSGMLVPVSYDMLHIIVKMGTISFASSFTVAALIPSGPAALCGLSCSRCFCMLQVMIYTSFAA